MSDEPAIEINANEAPVDTAVGPFPESHPVAAIQKETKAFTETESQQHSETLAVDQSNQIIEDNSKLKQDYTTVESPNKLAHPSEEDFTNESSQPQPQDPEDQAEHSHSKEPNDNNIIEDEAPQELLQHTGEQVSNPEPGSDVKDSSSQPQPATEEKLDEVPQKSDIKNFIKQKAEEEIQQLSDDDIIIDGVSSDTDQSDSDSDSSSSSDSSDDDSDDDSDDGAVVQKEELDSDEEAEATSGPITSKNEVLDEIAPTLPEDYKLPENAPIEPIGVITALVENSVIIKANISGEFRVLKDQSVLCFEDRTILGPLFETFGKLQNPIYRVKFNSTEAFEKFKDCKGRSVYYVVPDSNFIYTDSIKSIKGTDASNCHDEELPEEEQEFSDDEKEAEVKSSKKKKKNKKKNENQEPRKRPNDASNSDPKRFQPYGYAQPQPSHQPNPRVQYANYAPQAQQAQQAQQHLPQQQPPQQAQFGYANQMGHPQQYGAPVSQINHMTQPHQNQSPYGVPYNQVQFAGGHQAYGHPQHQHQFHNPSLPPYPGYLTQNQHQHPVGYAPHNQWNAQMQHGQAFQNPVNIQQPANYQQPANLAAPVQFPPNTQQAQLQQLQQLIANQIQQNQQNQPPPNN